MRAVLMYWQMLYEAVNGYDKAIAIRRHLRHAIFKMVGIPADILLLGTREIEQTHFSIESTLSI
ncbi:hypothetical protein ACYOEI_36880 [Singulisphaera rosea]